MREQETRRLFFAVRRKANCCLIVWDFQAKRKTRIKLSLGYQVKLNAMGVVLATLAN